MVDYETDANLIDKELKCSNYAVTAVYSVVSGDPFTEEYNTAMNQAASATVLTDTDSPSDKVIRCARNSATDANCNLFHHHQLVPNIYICC